MTDTLPTPLSPRHLEQMARALPAAESMFGALPFDPQWRPVAFYPGPASDEEGEGADVTVSVLRLPSMSWRIDCPALGLHLETGAEGHYLASIIATALSIGMLAPGPACTCVVSEASCGAGDCQGRANDDHRVVPEVGMRPVPESPLPAQLPQPGEGR